MLTIYILSNYVILCALILTVAPTVDRLTLMDQKVRAGRPITYQVAIKGEPPPNASWSINDKPVIGNPRVEVRTTPALCFFEILISARSDTGKYTLNLENGSGRLSTSATVTVVGMYLFYKFINIVMCFISFVA